MSDSNRQTNHVLFTHGYFLEEDPKEKVIMKPYPPLGILYLSAWLSEHGVENKVFDTTFSSKSVLFETLLREKPRILALYTNLMTKINVLEIVQFIRSHQDLDKTLIVMGGPDVTHNVEDYLRCGADLIVIGEGEQTMLELSMVPWPDANRHQTQAFAHISGLAMLTQEGMVWKTPPREKIQNIDTLPFPAREQINLTQYLDTWKTAHGLSAISLSTQRGCPYTCKWCSTAVYGQSYRRRSPEKVVDEIVHLQQHYTFDLIWFVDDVFTVSHKWLSAFRDELKTRKVTIRFECISRADRMNNDVIQVLQESGCYRVWIGAESGSQRIIDAMDRRVSVHQVRDMIRAARHAGIEAGTFIMLGYPGETESDIRETVRHLKQSNPDLFTITVAYPIKGTGLYEQVVSTTPSALPWAQHTDRDIEFKRTYSRKYYDYAVRWTVNAVHLYKHRQTRSILSAKGVKLALKTGFARAGMLFYR